MIEQEVAPKTNGIVIVNFDDITSDNQSTGFALLLNNDLSLLDSLLFKNDETTMFNSLLGSCFGSVGSNLVFFTVSPNRLKQWFPESKYAEVRDIMARFGLRLDKYYGQKGMIDQAFDLLNVISTKIY